ncbi:MAG: PaaI family thioesterase [Longimicrobiales bacterium]
MANPRLIQFDVRVNGPPRVVQGGTLAGRMAAALGGPAEVTLRRPAPLGTELRLETRNGGIVLLRDEELLAQAIPARVEIDAPLPPSLDEAHAATHRYLGHVKHPFPTCYVCGTARAPGDGMRIFAGRLPSSRMVAADWTPDPSLAGDERIVQPESVWAALDCPGGWASVVDLEPVPVVLGRIAARIDRPVHAAVPHIVTAWKIASEGRKHIVGSAIFDPDGELCAIAQATWFEVEAKDWS